MIEINVRIKIDTNDPQEAYAQLQAMLKFSGHKANVSNYWLVNGKPIPKTVAIATKILHERKQQGFGNSNVTNLCDYRPKRNRFQRMLRKQAPKIRVLHHALNKPRNWNKDIDNLSGCKENSETMAMADLLLNTPTEEMDKAISRGNINRHIPNYFDVTTWEWK